MTQPTRRDVLRSVALGAGAAAFGLGATVRGETAVASAEVKSTTQDAVDRRVLGRVGKEVSILGLGLGSVFTRPYKDDRDAAQQLLGSALDMSINYFDTARGYGESEEIIGPFIEKHRDDIFLVSKSGDRSYDGFMREFETSLKNLRTDHLDLLHLHSFEPRRDTDLAAVERGAVKAVRELKEQGVVGHFGITGHSGAQVLMDAIKAFDPDAILTIFPADRPDEGRYEDELLPLARERKMGVIAMKTIRHARESDLRGSDLVRYALSLEGVCTAIVGLDTLAHLQENAKMASGFKPMDAQARAKITKQVQTALVGQTAPWDRPGYDDHRSAWA